MTNHPLDAITPDEIKKASKIVTKQIFSKISIPKTKIYFYQIDLHEVPKEIVFSKDEKKYDRQIFVCFSIKEKNYAKSYEVIVSLTFEKILSWKKLPKGCQPIVTLEEYEACESLIKKDENFIKAMKKRNLLNPNHWMM